MASPQYVTPIAPLVPASDSAPAAFKGATLDPATFYSCRSDVPTVAPTDLGRAGGASQPSSPQQNLEHQRDQQSPNHYQGGLTGSGLAEVGGTKGATAEVDDPVFYSRAGTQYDPSTGTAPVPVARRGTTDFQTWGPPAANSTSSSAGPSQVFANPSFAKPPLHNNGNNTANGVVSSIADPAGAQRQGGFLHAPHAPYGTATGTATGTTPLTPFYTSSATTPLEPVHRTAFDDPATPADTTHTTAVGDTHPQFAHDHTPREHSESELPGIQTGGGGHGHGAVAAVQTNADHPSFVSGVLRSSASDERPPLASVFGSTTASTATSAPPAPPAPHEHRVSPPAPTAAVASAAPGPAPASVSVEASSPTKPSQPSPYEQQSYQHQGNQMRGQGQGQQQVMSDNPDVVPVSTGEFPPPQPGPAPAADIYEPVKQGHAGQLLSQAEGAHSHQQPIQNYSGQPLTAQFSSASGYEPVKLTAAGGHGRGGYDDDDERDQQPYPPTKVDHAGRPIQLSQTRGGPMQAPPSAAAFAATEVVLPAQTLAVQPSGNGRSPHNIHHTNSAGFAAAPGGGVGASSAAMSVEMQEMAVVGQVQQSQARARVIGARTTWVAPEEKQPWIFGLCGCCGDSARVCMDITCCQPCNMARQVNAIDGRIDMLNTTALFGIVVCFCFYPCIVTYIRCSVVKRYNLDEHAAVTGLVGLVASPLSLCQTANELAARGVWPGGTCCQYRTPPLRVM